MKASSLYQLPTSTRARRTAAGLGLLLTFGLLALTGLCAAASRLAFLLGYPPSYGLPVLTTHLSPAPRVTLAASSLLLLFAIVRARRLALAALSGVTFSLLLAHYPVYSPTAYLRARDALLGSEFGPDLASAELWGLACASLAVLPALPYARSLFRLTRLGDLRGSSRFATKKDLLEAGFTLDSPNRPLAYSSGLPLGIFTDSLGRRSLVRLEGDSHVLLVAPPPKMLGHILENRSKSSDPKRIVTRDLDVVLSGLLRCGPLTRETPSPESTPPPAAPPALRAAPGTASTAKRATSPPRSAGDRNRQVPTPYWTEMPRP